MAAIVRTLKHIRETETKAKIAAEAKRSFWQIFDFEFYFSLGSEYLWLNFYLCSLCNYSCAWLIRVTRIWKTFCLRFGYEHKIQKCQYEIIKLFFKFYLFDIFEILDAVVLNLS